jgi:DNA repair protein RadC
MFYSVDEHSSSFPSFLCRVLRIQHLKGRIPRKNSGVLAAMRLYSESGCAELVSKSLPTHRFGHFSGGCWFASIAGMFNDKCAAILAIMDECNASHFRPFSPAHYHKRRSGALGLLESDFALELSDAVPAVGRHILAPSEVEKERCRSLLESILTPLAKSNAGVWSKKLINRFGSLSAVLSAESHIVQSVIDDDRLPPFLAAIKSARLHTLATELAGEPVLANSESLINYLMAKMVNNNTESLKVLFLNAANRLLADEDFGSGSVSSLTMYPRAILKRALELNGTALILVHNHPSGNPQPSLSDIEATRAMAKAAQTLGIALHDHLIIATGGWTSMRSIGAL